MNTTTLLLTTVGLFLVFFSYAGVSKQVYWRQTSRHSYNFFYRFKIFKYLIISCLVFSLALSGEFISFQEAINLSQTTYNNSRVFTLLEKPHAAPEAIKFSSIQNNKLHPVVVNLPAEVETSIKSVAEYIAKQESDPYLRIKALHDYVTDRITYDVSAFLAHQYPPQDAETVFKTRKAVCAGYARLFKELGNYIGENIIVLQGNVKTNSQNSNRQYHAWNAVKINNYWYLIDPTWNSGYIEANQFTKKYTTEYLFTTPQIMALSHFPDNSDWQLLADPLSKSDFESQPTIKPNFFTQGFKLIFPNNFPSQVQQIAQLTIDNPQEKIIFANFQEKDRQTKIQNCRVKNNRTITISCVFPNPGNYEVSLFSSSGENIYNYIGSLDFNASGSDIR